MSSSEAIHTPGNESGTLGGFEEGQEGGRTPVPEHTPLWEPESHPKNTKSSVLLNGKRSVPPGVRSMPKYRRSALCTCFG